ncbi:hypothetical protein [Azospirillum sp. ST 5-10]|uniref:hypothetical protein n=1 Tax=unclassified Azospirillum TaxID=2630922 RepID=UPI003F4A0843
MTIIAAITSPSRQSTWIASDTLLIAGSMRQFGRPKWVVRPPWAAGVAGHLRTINLIEDAADEFFGGLADGPAGVSEFTRRLRQRLKAEEYRGTEEGPGPLDFGQAILLARPDGVWAVGCDFSIMPVPADHLAAEGTGREYAVGAAFALATHAALSRRERLAVAVETAMAFDIGCGGEVWLHELA